MNHTLQAAFVRDLVRHVETELIKDIEAGRTPDTWNGIELRALLAERFARARAGREGERRFWGAYRNEVLTRNL